MLAAVPDWPFDFGTMPSEGVPCPPVLGQSGQNKIRASYFFQPPFLGGCLSFGFASSRRRSEAQATLLAGRKDDRTEALSVPTIVGLRTP